MKKLLCSLLALLSIAIFAQDLRYARQVIGVLAAPEMHGRGYVQKGDSIAAEFIKTEMALNGLRAFNSDYFQFFNISVNTLPGNMRVSLNNTLLQPGNDYLVLTPSSGISGRFKTVHISHKTKLKKINKLRSKGLKGKALIIDNTSSNATYSRLFDELRYYNLLNAEAVLTITNKPYPMMWGVYSGHLRIDFPSIEINKPSVKKKIKSVALDIENEYHPSYRTQNVIGYIEGTQYPDSFIVFIAHYDHLGRMGRDTYFPGAHDNASGVAMMLDLAGHYTENHPAYSVAFIAAAAEEAGLLGSRYYTQNPLFPLENIKFLINLDMVSTGEEGLMVVNGDIFTDDFSRLREINEQHSFLSEIKSRGEAANSDHYFFYAAGVKSFYFYTLGGTTFYHNINDKPEVLSMYGYNNLFRLITHFIQDLSTR